MWIRLMTSGAWIRLPKHKREITTVRQRIALKLKDDVPISGSLKEEARDSEAGVGDVEY